MKHIFSICTLLVLVFFIGIPASGQLLEDNFTAAAGTALLNAGWTLNNSTTNPLTITSPGLTFTGYAPSGIGNAVSMANTGQDDYRGFVKVTSGSVYLSFMANISAVGTGDYFIALSPSAVMSNYYARLHVKSSGSGFVVGISKNNEVSGGAQYGTTVFSLNTTYLFIVKYTFVAPATAADTVNDPISVYCLPSGTSLATEPTTPEIANYLNATKVDATDLGNVTLRQGSAGAAPTLVIDGIRISTSWNAVVKAWNKVTFNLNTSTDPDTIRPGTAVVQVRGDTYPLTWGNDALTMTNVNGDYWTATATFINGTAIQYQYYVNTWSGASNTNLTVNSDTVLPLWYYLNGTTPPFTITANKVNVFFRVNMGSSSAFTPSVDSVLLYGNTSPLSNSAGQKLVREGTSLFYSGVVPFPTSVKGSTINYKFAISAGTGETSNRSFVPQNDTTLAWVTYNNGVILPPDTVNVTFIVNTSTIPDTLSSTSTIQLRGSLPGFTWDNGSVFMTSMGGDYWKAKVKFLVTHKTNLTGQYKVFTNVKSSITSADNGWENNTTDASGNRILNLGPIGGNMDTVLAVQYANGSPSAQPQFWRPYVPAKDSVAVMFRIDMQSLEGFNKAITKLGVRGSLAPLDWGKSIFLTEEQNHGNAGQTGYDGTNFWSAVAKFPRSVAATIAQYKFVEHAIADSANASPTWESIDNRTFSFNPTMSDTTLYWAWWNNQIMLPFSGHDTVIITFRADLAKAISGNGFVYGDTLVVRSGYISSAVALREKKMLRIGTSSKYQAVDTVTTKLATYLFYQYYKTPASGEVREIYFNFADPGTSAESEKRRFKMSGKTLIIQDTVNSTSDERRMPLFQNMKHLAQNMVVTYTCDVRPAIYQLKKGSKLISTNITNYVISNPDSVKYYGVWMDGPAVGGWDVGGAWGADRRLVDTAKMWDDGTHGDLVAHDSIYTLRYSYTTAATVGQEFKFGIYGCDNEGGYGNNHIENINDANSTATVASQFGSIDPVFFNAWNYTTQSPVTGVEQISGGIPLAYNLDQNYPNPFNPSTKIDYSIKAAGLVSLKVFNLLGQVVATLTEGKQEAGNYSIVFDASRFSSGIYFYQLTAGNFVATKKMMFLK